eukprot:3765357-Prymnesium_polylepis.3
MGTWCGTECSPPCLSSRRSQSSNPLHVAPTPSPCTNAREVSQVDDGEQPKRGASIAADFSAVPHRAPQL